MGIILTDKIKELLPGIWVTFITGLAALFLGEHYDAPVMLFALLLGLALSFLYDGTKCQAGIEFTACHILRIGVALLGLRIAFNDLLVLGWQTALLLVAAIASTIIFGVVLAKAFGLRKRFGVLTGGAVGICGASAAMAVSAVMPQNKEQERDTLLTIIGVTSLSTLAMILYPMLAGSLGLDARDTSIFLGGTIHDVARVAFLMPVVLCILLVLRMNLGKSEGKAPGVPAFLIGFAILMIINSVVDVPTVVTEGASQISRFALVISIAAIGMKSNLKQLLTVGAKPVILMVLETLWIAMLILLGIYLL
jgi:uncharacterized membrane protein YadS